MSGGYGCIRNVPHIADYDKAVRLEANIKPIRGRGHSIKPLASRRNDCLTIRKDADNIVIKLYQTDVVTFKPSGEVIVSMGRYSNLCTRSVIWDVAYISTDTVPSYSRVCATKSGEARKKGIMMHAEGDNIFIDGVLQNPASINVYELNKEALKKVKKEYKEFRTYFKMIEKLGEGWGEWNYKHDTNEFILNAQGRFGVEGFYEAGASLARSSGLSALLNRIKHHHRNEVYTSTTQFTPPSLAQIRTYKIYIGEVR